VKRVAGWARALYGRLDGISGGRISLVREAGERFGSARGPQAAAAMAYYAVFSLFPLMLVLVSILGFLMSDEEALRQAVDFVGLAVPVSRDLIADNLRAVQQLRGPVGILGVLALIWSASGVFSVLAHNLNLAWRGSQARSVVGIRLLGLAMVGVLFVLLVLSVASGAIVDLLQRVSEPTGLLADDSLVWEILSTVVPWFIALLLFSGLYRWVPNADVDWGSALWAALVAATAWELSKGAFLWYVDSELSQYELVYGSLGAVVALMLWSYISSWIILFGAHLAAQIGDWSRRRCSMRS
jgi:membrane protein